MSKITSKFVNVAARVEGLMDYAREEILEQATKRVDTLRQNLEARGETLTDPDHELGVAIGHLTKRRQERERRAVVRAFLEEELVSLGYTDAVVKERYNGEYLAKVEPGIPGVEVRIDLVDSNGRPRLGVRTTVHPKTWKHRARYHRAVMGAQGLNVQRIVAAILEAHATNVKIKARLDAEDAARDRLDDVVDTLKADYPGARIGSLVGYGLKVKLPYVTERQARAILQVCASTGVWDATNQED